MNNYDFVKPIFSKHAKIKAIAKALIVFKEKCGNSISFKEAVKQVIAYKKRNKESS